MITNLQLLSKLAHEMMDNTIGVDTVDSGGPRRSTCTPDIVPFTLLKVKKHEESYNRKAKFPISLTRISKTEMRQL